MNIHRALADIAEIRAQLDRTESYRGFRSTAVGVSVILLLAGACAELIWVANPATEVDRFLAIWLCVAVASAVVAGIEMVIRTRVSQNELVTKMHWSLVRQIAPSLVVGFVLTLLIAGHALEQNESSGLMWALPGVWSMIYGLGLFSCYKHLPAQSLGVASFFLVVGVLVLAVGWSTREVAAWQMLVSFGIGQSWLAIVLFYNLERRRDETK
jgi:hypothetical protein